MPLASQPVDTPQLALYLDTDPTRDFMAYIVDLCRNKGARLVCLAPPPLDLAVSRLEPHLGYLEQAGIAWEILPADANPEANLPPLFRQRPGMILLACDSRSRLARRWDSASLAGLHVPLLILLGRDSETVHAEPDGGAAPDWLAPRFNRGF